MYGLPAITCLLLAALFAIIGVVQLLGKRGQRLAGLGWSGAQGNHQCWLSGLGLLMNGSPTRQGGVIVVRGEVDVGVGLSHCNSVIT